MRITGRPFRIVVLLLTPLGIAGCAASGATDSQPSGIMRGSPCAGNAAGEASRQAPIVCVDDSARTLSVRPDPVAIHDVLENNRSAPVVLQWFTTSGTGDLQLEIEPGCVSDVRCNGRGHCTARSVPRAARSCKYDVWINGGNHDRLDPTIVISPCCG
jgi:hypothetical protein